MHFWELLNNPAQLFSMLGAVFFMVFFFGFCVFIHELGHFLAAKLCGMHIIAFSIGFKKIWGKKIGGVEYRIGCLPFGGYVDLPQIDATGEAKDENGNPLPKAEPWKRMVTAFAGPLFNVLFGLLLGCVIWIFGLPQDTPNLKEFKVLTIEEKSPEYTAGLRVGDRIVKLNGKTFECTWNTFVRDIMLGVGDTTLEVLRDGKRMTLTYRPVVNKEVAPQEEIAYPFFRPEIPLIVYPAKGSPAELAGVKPGDRILKYDGREVFGADELELRLMESKGATTMIEVQRGTERKMFAITPKVVDDPKKHVYQVGANLSLDDNLLVSATVPGSPAAAHLKAGDRLKQFNQNELKDFSDFVSRVQTGKTEPFQLTFERDGKLETVTMQARLITLYTLGMSYSMRTYPNPVQQFNNVVVLTWKSLRGVLTGLKNKLGFKEQYTTLQAKHFSGPIGIGKYLYISVYRGSLLIGINLVVLITFNLGLLNLMPLPVLDGGHIVLSLYEMIFRRRLSAKVLQPLTITFVVLLVSFMLFVSVYDVKKLFGF